MQRSDRIIWVPICIVIAGALCLRCDDEPGPPPKKEPPRQVEPAIDLTHVARIKADRSFTVSELVFVFQAGPSDSGVTLTTAKPNADGSMMLFGAVARARSLDAIAKSEIDFANGALLDAGGNGIFTALAVYQPKFAKLKVTSFSDQEIHGTITGEFYKHRAAALTVKPSVVPIECTFNAKLVVR